MKIVGMEAELYGAAKRCGAFLDAERRDFIDMCNKDCLSALRCAESAWHNTGPLDRGDWTPDMEAYRRALCALQDFRIDRHTAESPTDTTAQKRGLPLYDLIKQRGD